MIRPFVKDLYWLPIGRVNKAAVRRYFKFKVPSKENPDVDDIICLWRVRRARDGRKWIGLPRGRPDLVKKCLVSGMKMSDIEDRRARPKVKIPLKFNGKYRDYQLDAVIDLADCDNGVLVSAPRTGKTIMAVAAAVERQMRTLIIAHQTDLIEQFCNETINSPDMELFDGAAYDKPVAGICSKLSDFKKYPICLVTYQTFLSDKGQRLLGKVKDMFGIVITDEVHMGPAPMYSTVLSGFSALCMWGLTATPDRKDGKYTHVDRLIGPVIHRTDAKVLRPRVGLFDTTGKLDLPSEQPTTFTHIVGMLAESDNRNKIVAELAVRQVERGHIVLIPTIRVGQATILATMIDNKWGDKISFEFTGKIPKNKRQEARDRMNDDETIMVVLATRSMLPGMNIKRWSSLISQAPIANEPKYEQEVFRICTPMKGKPRPEIIYVFDGDVGISWPFFHKCKSTFTNPDFGFRFTKRYARFAGIARTSGTLKDIM